MPPPTPPDLIGPNTGPLEGGVALMLYGGTNGSSPNVYVDTSRDDDFAGTVIDPGKWVASTSGSGTVLQDDGLTLRTGTTANSSAVLTSFATFDPIGEFQIDFDVVTPVVSSPPATTTRFLDAELRVDASNYFRVSREYDATLPPGQRQIFRIVCVIGGAMTEQVIVPNDIRIGTLRLVRVRNRVVVQVNSATIYDGAPFVTTAAYLVFRAVNPSATHPYDVSTTLNRFVVPTTVLFNTDAALVREAAVDYVRAEAPAVPTPRVVTLRVYTAAGFVTELLDAFTYYLAYEFRVLSSAGSAIGIVNDSTLRNRTAGRPGLLL